MISAILVAGNVINSCSKVEDIIDDISIPVPFTIPVNFDAQIPLATANTTDPVTYPEIPVNIDVDAKIKEAYPSLSINNLKSAKLNSFSIELIPTTGGLELDAIKDAKLYIKTPDLPKKPIAEVTGNTNKSIINFTPTANTDLIDYLKSKQNSFILEITGSKVAAGIIKIKVNAGFKVEVGL